MIVVAGSGRCGTSLMMQTLNLLGVPLVENPEGWGKHQLWLGYEETNNLNLSSLPTNKNPKGYFELSYNKIFDIIHNKDTDRYTGKAIKFTTPELIHLDPDKIDQIIFCERRNIRKAAKSMALLARQDYDYAVEHCLEFCFASIYPSVKIRDWEKHMKMFNETTKAWMKAIKKPNLHVWFEDLVNTPEPIIQHLGDFLNLDNPDTSEALKNVDKK
tara:strand:- start:3535 stop:4179 length:645 start_codon:yes stop_codon:yes gene_type:complete